jgi:hypothetical protein
VRDSLRSQGWRRVGHLSDARDCQFVTEKITSRLRASAWMVVAGILGMVAVLLVVEAAVFALASFGLALHWSCLLVAAVLIAIAAAAFFHGRSVTDDDLLPSRTARQITQDIKTAKQQLT